MPLRQYPNQHNKMSSSYDVQRVQLQSGAMVMENQGTVGMIALMLRAEVW